jgi:glycosyltransferase involved in cell wall biosynthesis
VKRFDLAIRAISVLRREFPDVHLTIAGTGPLHAELHSLVKDLDLGASVSLPGYVSDTGELFRKSDIFVLPSETEGSPITLIEAMAYAKPIVASAVGAIPEMVFENAGSQLITPCNLEQLVHALRRFMSDPVYRRASGRLARKRFESSFSAEKMAARYSEQYEACLRGAR